jgi:hypothetical protein
MSGLIEHITMCERDHSSVKEIWFLVCMHSQFLLQQDHNEGTIPHSLN